MIYPEDLISYLFMIKGQPLNIENINELKFIFKCNLCKNGAFTEIKEDINFTEYNKINKGMNYQKF